MFSEDSLVVVVEIMPKLTCRFRGTGSNFITRYQEEGPARINKASLKMLYVDTMSMYLFVLLVCVVSGAHP